MVTGLFHCVHEPGNAPNDGRECYAEDAPAKDEQEKRVKRQVGNVRPDSGPHGRARVLMRFDD